MIEPMGTLERQQLPPVPGSSERLFGHRRDQGQCRKRRLRSRTTALDAAGVTTTYTDLAFGPASTDI